MPDYIIYNPASSPIAGRVTGFRRSHPKEREAELGANIIESPNLDGIDVALPMKVTAGVVTNLTQQERDTETAAQTAAAASMLKQAAKDIFITPQGADRQALKLAFETLIELTVSEINILRAASVPALAARTNNQIKTAFKNAYESKIDSL